MHALNKVNFKWSEKTAYVIGLIASDGCLYNDGHKINFTSKDLELAKLFKEYLNLSNKIGKKARGGEKEKRYYNIQFGDVIFYRFLNRIGITSAKSKTIGKLEIQEEYFFDFLRGLLDGDGNIKIYKHPESKNPQLHIRFTSASKKFLEWVKNKNSEIGVKGYIMEVRRAFVLEYAMSDSINLLSRIYHKNFPPSLTRKLVLVKTYLPR